MLATKPFVGEARATTDKQVRKVTCRYDAQGSPNVSSIKTHTCSPTSTFQLSRSHGSSPARLDHTPRRHPHLNRPKSTPPSSARALKTATLSTVSTVIVSRKFNLSDHNPRTQLQLHSLVNVNALTLNAVNIELLSIFIDLETLD